MRVISAKFMIITAMSASLGLFQNCSGGFKTVPSTKTTKEDLPSAPPEEPAPPAAPMPPVPTPPAPPPAPIITAPTIVAGLAPLTVTEGTTLTTGQFCVTATGTDPITYSWSKEDGTVAPYNSNKRCYTTSTLTAADSGTYKVTVTNSAGSANSSATLTVKVPPPPPPTIIDSVSFYTFQKTSADGKVNVTAPWGTWEGFVATTDTREMSPGKSAHVMEFEFSSSDYFSSANVGHFAIGIRGDSVTDADGDGKTDLQGRGVVIGNVSQYASNVSDCNAAPSPNRVTIESFWAGGNCVYGSTTSSPVLQNNEAYKLMIKAQATTIGSPLVISYSLSQSINGVWNEIYKSQKTESSLNTSNKNLAGWFIAEVFSNRPWTMSIKNLKTYQE